MAIFIFTYGILLILLCSAAFSITLAAYIMKKKTMYLHFSFFFFCCILEFAELHFYAYFPGVSGHESSVHIDFLGWKIFICFCFLLAELLILLSILQKKWRFTYLLLFVPLFAAGIFLGLQPKSGISVWLFYSLRQLYRLGYCARYFAAVFTEHNTSKKASMEQYLFPAASYLLFTCCIFLEDGFFLAVIDYHTFYSPYIVERNFSENILCAFFGLYMILKCLSSMKKEKELLESDIASNEADSINTEVKDCGKVPQDAALSENSPRYCLLQWKAAYLLTPREVQILELVFHKGNEEICSELSISPATLKKHLHNIYYKTGVNSKTELFRKLNPMSDTENT